MKKWFMIVIAVLLMMNGVSVATAAKLDAKTYKVKKTALDKQGNALADQFSKDMGNLVKMFKPMTPEMKNRIPTVPVRSTELQSCLTAIGLEYTTEEKTKSVMSDEDQTKYDEAYLKYCQSSKKITELTEKIEKLDASQKTYEKAKNYDRALKALQTALTTVKQLISVSTALQKEATIYVSTTIELLTKYPEVKTN